MVLGNPFEKSTNADKQSSSSGEGAALPFDRLAAHIADFILLLPIMALVMAPFRRAVMEAKLLDNAYDSDWALLQGLVAAFAVGILWDTFFISMWGTSPGRAIFGMRVVDIWTGQKPRAFNAFMRSLTWYVSLLSLGAPFFAVYGNLRRRPLHDRVGDTEVRARSTKRQSAPPQMWELAVGSLFTTGAVFFATLILTSQAFVFQEHARLAEEKDEPKLCDEVSIAADAWEGRDARPTRISVALSLSSSGMIDSDCLEREADFALWNGQGRLLGYLAKGLIRYGRDIEDSESYFAKVCELEPDSDSCRIVGWYRDFALQGDKAEDEINRAVASVESIEKIGRSLLPKGPRSARSTTTPDWLRLMVLRELFVQKGDAQLILQLTEEPARYEAVGAKLVEYRVRALWRLDQKREAKATVWTSADALPRAQRVVLTSWLCNRELYESSRLSENGQCSADAHRACEMMESAADEVNGDLSTPAFVVASLRHAECRVGSGHAGRATFSELAEQVEESSGKKLIESVRLLQSSLSTQPEKHILGLTQLRELAALPDSEEDMFVTEANIRLVEELGKRPVTDKKASTELADLRERWYKSQKARHYSDWGRAIFEALVKRQDWSRAAEVGVILGGEFDFDRSLQKKIAVAAWKAGKLKLASELVDSLEKTRFPASIESSVFSDDAQSDVLNQIRRSGGNKKTSGRHP